MALTTTQLRAAWAPPCSSGRGVTLTLNGGGRFYVDRRISDAVRALNACLVAFHYLATAPDCGAYNCRQITGGKGYSLHAYLIALDINWLDNPYGTSLVTDMPAAMVGAITAIRTVNGAQVWRWGGSYAGHKDAMHYEVVCTPRDLATGIDWRTVIGVPTSNTAPYAWVPDGPFQPGSHQAKVAQVQLALELLRPLTHGPQLHVTTPPGYGPNTTKAVRRLQEYGRNLQRLNGEVREDHLIDVDGIWGPATGRLARFLLPSASATAKAAA